jgi:hypothetical protein
MTRGQRAFWIALIALQVPPIAAATVLFLVYLPGRPEPNRNQEWATCREDAAEHRWQSSDHMYEAADFDERSK